MSCYLSRTVIAAFEEVARTRLELAVGAVTELLQPRSLMRSASRRGRAHDGTRTSDVDEEADHRSNRHAELCEK
jgi:hypothetical protein